MRSKTMDTSMFDKDTVSKYARIAKIPYQRYNATRRQHIRQTIPNIGVYRPDLSNERIVTIIDQANKKAHISYRGSKSLDDWAVHDVNILHGRHKQDQYFNDAKQHLLDLHRKMGDKYEYNLYGHSLGGGVAEYVHTAGKEKGVRKLNTFTFNAPHLIDNINPEGLYHFRTGSDPVSVIHQHDPDYVTPGGHGIDNFL